MFVNTETVGLHSDVILEVPLNGQELALGLLSLGQLGVELVDGDVDGADLLHHLDVRRVLLEFNNCDIDVNADKHHNLRWTYFQKGTHVIECCEKYCEIYLAVFYLWPVAAPLQPRLGHLERRPLGPDGGLHLVYVGVLVLDLLLDHPQLGPQLVVRLLTFLAPLKIPVKSAVASSCSVSPV